MNESQQERTSPGQRPLSEGVIRLQVKLDAAARVLDSLFQWGSLLGCMYFLKDVLQAYAGQTSLADISFSLLVNEHAGVMLSLVFGGGGIAYGLKQRNLRKATVARLHRYQELYERSLDPGRTSSGLTERGDTQEIDK